MQTKIPAEKRTERYFFKLKSVCVLPANKASVLFQMRVVYNVNELKKSVWEREGEISIFDYTNLHKKLWSYI